MNIIEVHGHLGADPETRFTGNGQKVTNLRLASNVYQKGEDITMWWRVTVWGEHPLLQHLKKGSAVIVIGEMKKPEIWTDRNGNPQVSLDMTAEIIRFPKLGGKKQDGESGGFSGGQQQQQQQQQESAVGQGSSMEEDPEDDLPF